VVLALLAGIGAIVPIVGPILATIPIVGIALLTSPTTALAALIFWVVLQQIETYAIMPNIMSKQADIPPLLVLLAVFAGGGIGGILGALIAIPLSGALRVFILRVIAPGIRRWTGAIDGDLIGPPPPASAPRPAEGQ
jgi:predicted PurR-regulated permease PerM